jgi:hypothetical protein
MDKIFAILNKVKAAENGFDSLSQDDKIDLFKAMAREDEIGERLRVAYGAVQGPLLLPVIRQESQIRRIYKEQFTGGEQVEFPIRSKRIRAGWYGADGANTPMRQATQSNIYIHTFRIDGGCRWPLKQLRTGNYNLVEELQNDMIDTIVYKEDLAGWTLAKAALTYGDIESIATLTTSNSDITDNKQGTSLSVNVLAEMITVADEKPEGGRMLTDLFITPRRYGDLRKWVTTDLQDLADGTRGELFNAGQAIGEKGVWDIAIHKVRDAQFVDNTKAWGFAKGFGIMAVGENWHTTNDPTAIMKWEMGLIGKEEIGMGIVDVEGAVVYSF